MMTLTENQIRVIKRLVGYKGRKVHTKEYKADMSLNSYWDSGSRDYYYYIAISPTGLFEPRLMSTVPQNGTPFDKLNLRSPSALMNNTILVEKTIIRGKDVSITIYS